MHSSFSDRIILKYRLVKFCNSHFLHSLFPQLLDLCILDVNSLDFQYRTLAAAALCHYTSIEVVKKASGKKLALVRQGIQKGLTCPRLLRLYWFTRLPRSKSYMDT